jgi:tRNA (guanine26-N2/guanine27-N2)-dimethyltransferase
MNNESKIQKITEGETEVFVYINKKYLKGPGYKSRLPFYNPSMRLNRDLSVLIIQYLCNNICKKLKVLDGLAASGIRGVRFANEVYGDFEVTINDWSNECFNLIKKNVDKYGFINVKVERKNINILLSDNFYDYIDVDPFGSPVSFIDSAMRSIKNDGIIACTATDTATLCGVYPKVCLRRYGAIPFHSFIMHEVGIRILLGYLCREAAKYDKGISPILSYYWDYYFRVYLKITNSKKHADESIKKLSYVNSSHILPFEKKSFKFGPIWMGIIQNNNLLNDLISLVFCKKLDFRNEILLLLNLLSEESDFPAFFYTTEYFSSNLGISPPKIKNVFECLEGKSYRVSKTHFSFTGFKTNAPFEIIKSIFKN